MYYSNKKKITPQKFPNTKGKSIIKLQNRALLGGESALFCSLIVAKPFVLGKI